MVYRKGRLTLGFKVEEEFKSTRKRTFTVIFMACLSNKGLGKNDVRTPSVKEENS